MQRVRIVSAAAAHPGLRIQQCDAAARIAAVVGSHRRVHAIARGTQIESRAVVIPPQAIERLGSTQARNAIYQAEAPTLALAAVRGLDVCLGDVSFLTTSSCTGYMVPGLDVHLAQALGLRPDVARLPITEAGCAGGVVAIARAADYLRRAPRRGLVVASEVCSLAFHADSDEGNLTSALIFGDGAGAVLLESGAEPGGVEIVDEASTLVPCSRDLLGFNLTDTGFYPLLARNLAERLPGPSRDTVTRLLSRNGLCSDDLGFWLVHPGGPRVLETLQREMGLSSEDLRWSWQALRRSGNTSSAAIVEVLADYLADPTAPRGWGIVLAFGPGVSIEALLVRRC